MGFANVSDWRESWRGAAPRAKEKHPEKRINLFSGYRRALKKRLTKSLYTKDWEALLRLLRDLREARGWTQEQLAEKLGRPQSTVSKIEAGERKLDVCQFIDYLRILKADPVTAMQRLMKVIQKP